jgi:tRNA (mo5U34)-methyltransferase
VSLHAEVSSTVWYHTIDLGDGVVTPGWFDLRPVVERMPWPDVAGKRCLDVGTYDGFLAFELERRGAAEVVCTDIADHAAWDWPLRIRARAGERLADLAGPQKGHGFEVARRALGSSVQKVELNVYDLSAERLGKFDVVVCGSLLLHLREPVRGLEAIRSVCDGRLLSAEAIRLGLSLLRPRTALAELDGISERCQWWTPNAAGHRRLVEAAGFDVERSVKPYAIPYGPAHPPRTGWTQPARRPLRRALTGNRDGVPHAALLARPAL